MRSLHRVAFASIASSLVGIGLIAPPRSGGVEGAPPGPKSPERPDAHADALSRVGLAEIDAVPAERWALLRERRIYFAHQSVGGNMMRGLGAILRERPAIGIATRRLVAPSRETPTTARGAFESPGLVHGPAGSNGDPAAKFDSFERFVTGAGGEAIDVAFVKLCYADISASTDVDALFARYAAMVERIRKARPGLTVLHATVPLKSADQGAKGAVKRLAGGGTGPSNAARGRYNLLLRARYPKREIVDIARAESRELDGSEVTTTVSGVAWPVLCAGYTSDGGHLNEVGQVVVARALLLALAEHASPSASGSRGNEPDGRGADRRPRDFREGPPADLREKRDEKRDVRRDVRRYVKPGGLQEDDAERGAPVGSRA
jgi:hypothetical protein